ncbi:MAG: hypothetical protein DMF69_13720 [Acidobacteria bacterium]|nr:MAG: hypothetical protein DMF69_13720 [Acidobacteriota bacterium]
MNGQLSEISLPELIRELTLKNLSGRLGLESNKIKVVIYFNSGSLMYAACNVRSLRLSEYLLKAEIVTEDDLLHLGARISDFQLIKTLLAEKKTTRTQADQLQAKQVTDILRLASLWTEGTWEFDNRSLLNEEISFIIDVSNLLLEAGRRLPLEFTASRFRNPNESFAPVENPPTAFNLLPSEVFILSRVDRPILLNDLKALSGLDELETYRAIFSLALVDLLKRSSWKHAFRDQPKEVVKEEPIVTFVEAPPAVEDSVEMFLDRLSAAETHYEVLGVNQQTTMSELKNAYYSIARKYHPDKFRSAGEVLGRVESAFARITQAYDTLRDPGLRATYDSKLDAQSRAASVSRASKKGAGTGTSESVGVDDPNENAYSKQAELQFKEGLTALELRQRNAAIGLLGAAARAVPDEPRYRAYYGRALAIHESTRRMAEVELQAAVRLEPQNAAYRIMLAELYRDLGFKVRAKGEAERAVAADRNNREARDLLKSLE